MMKSFSVCIFLFWNILGIIMAARLMLIPLITLQKAIIFILYSLEEGFKPKVYVLPRKGQDKAALEKALAAAVAEFNKTYPGVAFKPHGEGWIMDVPQKYEIGHEAHFSQVMQMYLGWMKKGEQPADYLPNMIVKYYTLTEAWKASR